MREIKFRAWHKGRKKIVEITDLNFMEKENIKCTYRDKPYLFTTISQDEVELMQFTGLQDKNGVDIYEGDIINSDYRAEGYRANLHGYIVFFRGGFCARTVKVKYFDDCPMSDLIIDSTEIIGNIYENPELLEVE